MSTDRELEEIFDDITMGMYVSQDGEEFTPVRWENSPLRQKYLERLKTILTEATREAELRARIDELRNCRASLKKFQGQIISDSKIEYAISKYTDEFLVALDGRIRQLQRTKNKEEGASK